MRGITLLTIILCLCTAVSAADYSDVLLVTNTNSTNSTNISNYFIAQRNITYRVNISAPTSDQISAAVYNTTIKIPIENYLIANNFTKKINYIVLTKGVPLRIATDANCRVGSVDSSLTIILSKYNTSFCAGNSTNAGRVNNPMYGGVKQANKTRYDMYVVTRLDGYTENDVFRMINSSANVSYNGTTIIDRYPGFGECPGSPADYSGWNCQLDNGKDSVNNFSRNLTYDNTSTFLMNKNNVQSYYSWGSTDGSSPPSNSSLWNLSFLPGGIGDMAVSTTARSFTIGTSYGQPLIADLIANNLTFVKGYTAEPTVAAISNPGVTFNRYLTNYTAAEAMYMGSPFINWMDIYVGDPKQRLLDSGRMPCNYEEYEAIGAAMNCSTVECVYVGSNCPAVQTYSRVTQTCSRTSCS